MLTSVGAAAFVLLALPLAILLATVAVVAVWSLRLDPERRDHALSLLDRLTVLARVLRAGKR